MTKKTDWLEYIKNSYDWQEVFKPAYSTPNKNVSPSPILGEGVDLSPFSMDDIEKVYFISDGFNDEDDWVAVMKLFDGRYARITAGCDYTGWG